MTHRETAQALAEAESTGVVSLEQRRTFSPQHSAFTWLSVIAAAQLASGYPQSNLQYVRLATVRCRLTCAVSAGGVLAAVAARLDELPRHEREENDDEGHAVGDKHGGRPVGVALIDEVLEKRRLEAARLAVKRPVLVEGGVEQQVGVGQRLAVDPLEQGNAAQGQEAGDDVQAFDRLIVDEKQREDGDMGGDEELPEEVDLRPNGQDRLDERRFLDHETSPRDAGGSRPSSPRNRYLHPHRGPSDP